jgi:hypothetical protein
MTNNAAAWLALKRGFVMLVDKADVGVRLTEDLAAVSSPAFERPAMTAGPGSGSVTCTDAYTTAKPGSFAPA